MNTLMRRFFLGTFVLLLGSTIPAWARHPTRSLHHSGSVPVRARRARHARRRGGRRVAALRHRRTRHYYGEVFTASPIGHDLGAHDLTQGEDPVVRDAAVKALGDVNGTAVVVDPNSGRILTMVNQGLALSADYQPCSTTKMAIALAALDRGVVNENTPVKIGRRLAVNMTYALAHSNNAYFEALGEKLGFATVSKYERQFGLGETAGLNLPGEDPGLYPQEPGPGGVAKLSSFGEGIHISPLQLAAMVSAIANGGTLYYLQHPATAEALADFHASVKRQLNIAGLLPELADGMMAVTRYGTARRAQLQNLDVFGKTGTCSRNGTRYGLFASYMDKPSTQRGKLAIVVVLRGNRAVYGPRAAQIAGKIYNSLNAENYFARPHTPASALSAAALALPLNR